MFVSVEHGWRLVMSGCVRHNFSLGKYLTYHSRKAYMEGRSCYMIILLIQSRVCNSFYYWKPFIQKLCDSRL